MKLYIKYDSQGFLTSVWSDPYHQPESLEVDVPEELGQEVLANGDCYKYIDNKFVLDDSRQQAALAKALLIQEAKAIQQWLKNHDYYINKVFLGEWEETDPRYVSYLTNRAIKLARYNEIEGILDA